MTLTLAALPRGSATEKRCQMMVDHILTARLFASAFGLVAVALAVRMLVTGRSFARSGRPINRGDNPIRFALSVVAALAVAVMGLLMAAGLVQPT